MKKKNTILLSGAMLALGSGLLGAEDRAKAVEVHVLEGAVAIDSDGEPKKSSSLFVRPVDAASVDRAALQVAQAKNRMETLQKELADLDAATEARRAALMAELVKARKAREELKVLKERNERLEAMRRRVAAADEANKAAEVKKMADEYEAARNYARSVGWLNKNVNDFAASSPSSSWIIGVQVQDNEKGKGLVIQKVLEGKPAAKVGLKAEDVILECNGIALQKVEDLTGLIQIAKEQPLVLGVRGQKNSGEKKVTVRAVKREENAKAAQPMSVGGVVNPLYFSDWTGPWRRTDFDQPSSAHRAFSLSNQTTLNRLHKDNQELKALLKELIAEVKKLADD